MEGTKFYLEKLLIALEFTSMSESFTKLVYLV